MNECYLIEVIGDIEPVLHGPYKTSHSRNGEALLLRMNDIEKKNGIFALDIINGKPSIYTYSGGYMETNLKGGSNG